MVFECVIPEESTEVLVIAMGAMMQAGDGLENRSRVVADLGLVGAAERWLAASEVVRCFENELRRMFTELSEGSSMGIPSK
jgi:hypothetical protein